MQYFLSITYEVCDEKVEKKNKLVDVDVGSHHHNRLFPFAFVLVLSMFDRSMAYLTERRDVVRRRLHQFCRAWMQRHSVIGGVGEAHSESQKHERKARVEHKRTERRILHVGAATAVAAGRERPNGYRTDNGER